MKEKIATREVPRPASAEHRLKELGIRLLEPPEPFGTYVEAVRTGNLLFLTGMLPTEGREAKFIGRVGAEVDVETGREAHRRGRLELARLARRIYACRARRDRVSEMKDAEATPPPSKESNHAF